MPENIQFICEIQKFQILSIKIVQIKYARMKKSKTRRVIFSLKSYFSKTK